MNRWIQLLWFVAAVSAQGFVRYICPIQFVDESFTITPTGFEESSASSFELENFNLLLTISPSTGVISGFISYSMTTTSILISYLSNGVTDFTTFDLTVMYRVCCHFPSTLFPHFEFLSHRLFPGPESLLLPYLLSARLHQSSMAKYLLNSALQPQHLKWANSLASSLAQ